MAEALGWGALAASSLVLGALLALGRRWPDRMVGLVLSFGAGALISAVSFELAEEGAQVGGPLPLALGLAVGALTYFLADGTELRSAPAQRTVTIDSQGVVGGAAAGVDSGCPGAGLCGCRPARCLRQSSIVERPRLSGLDSLPNWPKTSSKAADGIAAITEFSPKPLVPYVKLEKLMPEKRFTIGARSSVKGTEGNLSRSFNASASVCPASNPSKSAYAAATPKATRTRASSGAAFLMVWDASTNHSRARPVFLAAIILCAPRTNAAAR